MVELPTTVRVAACTGDGGLRIEQRPVPRPLVTHGLPLSSIADAVIMARERTALKILLEPDGS
jgi:hypothetical protein